MSRPRPLGAGPPEARAAPSVGGTLAPAFVRGGALTLALALALALVACPEAKPGGDGGSVPSAPCVARAQCAGGQVCTSAGTCGPCESSGQCGLTERCEPERRVCVWREGWGGDCARNEDCEAGRFCRQGLCAARAEVSLCPGGSHGECPDGQRCNRVTGVCEEDLGCVTDGDCSGAETCQPGTRACVPRCTVATQAAVCGPGERCVEPRCVECVDAGECEPGLACDAAGRCVAGPRCYGDRDCAVPLACFVPTGACLAPPPPCRTDGDCQEDRRCEVSRARCVLRACQPDVYEPNDTPDAATPTTQGSSPPLVVCPGDVDWFALALTRGDRLGVNVEADPFAERSFSTRVVDAAGRTVASGHLLASYVAPSAARYLVAVSAGAEAQPYVVTFLRSRGLPCDDDAFEPNDDAASATALNASTAVGGVVCPQDEDWFLAPEADGRGLAAALTPAPGAEGLLRLCVVAEPLPRDGGDADDAGVDAGADVDAGTDADAGAATDAGPDLDAGFDRDAGTVPADAGRAAPPGLAPWCAEGTAPRLSLGAAERQGRALRVRVTGTSERVSGAYMLEVRLP